MMGFLSDSSVSSRAGNDANACWGLLYKNRSSPKTDSLLANRSLTKIYSLNEDLFTNRESVFREDLFL